MGRQATQAGIDQAKIALTDLQITRKILQARLNLDRQPIDNFFKGKSVSDETFVGICEVLGLDWKTIAGIVGPQTPNSGDFETGSAPPELDIDAIVQPIRSAVRPLIQEQCGTMRVLDMDQPIELTGDRGIYTNVNILERQSRLRSEREMLEDCDLDNRRVRERRIPGLEAVEKHRRLMVLGKPGAGKTTFLKYLAMQCITGGFAADRVPFFVTLKDFAEADDRPSLVDYLSRLSALSDASPLLLGGRSLILLDGLDEVREEDTKRVSREMRDTADRFGSSQFVITCRIAAKEYTFERFTEVEVADFGGQQIATFAENWFRAKNDRPKAETFVQRLKENEPIYELARSPLLLTLLCLVFGDGADFPTNRADLYEEGVKILLKKWDAKRNIQRDELYKKLDVQRREDLLSYVALQTFQQKEYFIKQRRLEGYIADFIGNLRDVDPEPESLRIDSEKVLKSIQAQHGLLVERARGIYSFSHLTFQEYFTAREIATTNEIDFLVAQIGEKRWREVFLLTTGMMRNADKLLTAMKSQIDFMLTNDAKLQQFLKWALYKSSSVKTTYSSSAIRAFYFMLPQHTGEGESFDHPLAASLDKDLYFILNCNLALEHGYHPIEDFQLVQPPSVKTHILGFELNLDRQLIQELRYCMEFTSSLFGQQSLRFDYFCILQNTRARLNSGNIAEIFSGTPLDIKESYSIGETRSIKLRCELIKVYRQIPGEEMHDYDKYKTWWKTFDEQWWEKWTEDLRKIMIAHRNIGHDWQFTDAQKALLQQYYDANLLLVECLNSDCYVSRSVREEIEATLLLPVGEIES